MAHPVKLSDQLVLDARVTAEVSERSLSSQIELWASLGRAVEGLLRTSQLLHLKRRGEVRPLSTALEGVETDEGRARLAAYLATGPFPRFEPAEERGLLIKIDEDGTRTRGRFVKRAFVKLAE